MTADPSQEYPAGQVWQTASYPGLNDVSQAVATNCPAGHAHTTADDSAASPSALATQRTRSSRARAFIARRHVATRRRDASRGRTRRPAGHRRAPFPRRRVSEISGARASRLRLERTVARPTRRARCVRFLPTRARRREAPRRGRRRAPDSLARAPLRVDFGKISPGGEMGRSRGREARTADRDDASRRRCDCRRRDCACCDYRCENSAG